MKKGMTMVELLIAIAAISTIAVFATIFLYQTLVTRDKALAEAEATEVANTVLSRIKYAVPQATELTVNATELKIQEDTQCEEFSLVSGRIYYEHASGSCPISVTQEAITNASVSITNASAPTVTLFTGSPATDPLTVTTQIRVRVSRPLGSSEVTLRDSVSRRR